MLEIFRWLVKQEQPNFIIDFKAISSGELSAVYCKYEKERRFYTAVSFYTSTWISRKPSGPEMLNNVSACNKLADIASIVKHDTLEVCRSYPVVSVSDLEEYQYRVKTSTVSVFDDIFRDNPFGDTVVSSLMLAPAPAVVLTVQHGGFLVGTILVLLSGVVSVVFACDSRINEYARHMQQLMRQSPKLMPLCLEGRGVSET